LIPLCVLSNLSSSFYEIIKKSQLQNVEPYACNKICLELTKFIIDTYIEHVLGTVSETTFITMCDTKLQQLISKDLTIQEIELYHAYLHEQLNPAPKLRAIISQIMR
jgi:hypothetical protein